MGLKENDRHGDAPEGVDPDLGRHHEGEDEGRHEENGDEGDAPHQFHVARRKQTHDRHVAAPSDGERDPERHGKRHAEERKEHGKRKAAPHVGRNGGETRDAAREQRKEDDERHAPADGETAHPLSRPQSGHGTYDGHPQEKRHGDARTPLFFIRIASEKDEAPLLG